MKKTCYSIWWASALLGTFIIWRMRFNLTPDALSYLEIAEKVTQGAFSELVNGYWSPAFPALIAVALGVLRFFTTEVYMETFAISAVVLGGYLFAMFSFLYLLKTLRSFGGEEADYLPDWLFYPLLGLTFLTCTLRFNLYIMLWGIPDVYVCAMFFISSALILRIKFGDTRLKTHLLLGLSLGIGYLFKTILFPISLIFILAVFWISFFQRSNRREFFACLVPFIAISLPLIVALSSKYNHVTFGESGNLNYMWYVNKFPIYYGPESVPPGGSLLRNEIVFENPTIHAYENPKNVTYAFWYDPAYHLEGIEPRFTLGEQAERIWLGVVEFLGLLLYEQWATIASLLLLGMIPRKNWYKKAFSLYWPVLLPAFAGCALYIASTPLESRYLTPFFLVIWGCSAAAISGEGTKKLFLSVLIFATLGTTIILSKTAQIFWRMNTQNRFESITQPLFRAGLKEGDKIATMYWGTRSPDYYGPWTWAKFGQFKIAAEITNQVSHLREQTPDDVTKFLYASSETQNQVIEKLRSLEIRALIGFIPAEHFKNQVLPWAPVEGNPDFYVLFIN